MKNKAIKAAMMLSLIAGLSLPFSVQAKQSYDFSDIAQPFLNFPFEVVSIDVSGQAPKVHHNYHVADSYDAVIKKLAQYFDKKQQISDYFVLGMTKQSGREEYQVIFAYQNEHHYAQIRPEGAGTLIALEVTPASYVSGVFPISAYGFSLPDGSMTTIDKFTKE